MFISVFRLRTSGSGRTSTQVHTWVAKSVHQQAVECGLTRYFMESDVVSDLDSGHNLRTRALAIDAYGPAVQALRRTALSNGLAESWMHISEFHCER